MGTHHSIQIRPDVNRLNITPKRTTRVYPAACSIFRIFLRGTAEEQGDRGGSGSGMGMAFAEKGAYLAQRGLAAEERGVPIILGKTEEVIGAWREWE